MKPNCIVTVMVYGLKILGLAPFSYQIITVRKNLGTTCTAGGFRFSKIGMAYNILLVILIQFIPVSLWQKFGLADGSVLDSLKSLCRFLEFIFTFFATNVIIIFLTFRQRKVVSFMNRLVQIDCLISDVETQSVSKKMTFPSFSIHLIYNIVFWTCKIITTFHLASALLEPTVYSLMSFFIYTFIVEYSVVLGLLSGEIGRVNRNFLKIKELPSHSSSSQFSNDFLPVVRFPKKTHLDDVKLLLRTRTTLYELSNDVAEFFSFPILIAIASIFFRIAVNSYYFFRYLIDLDKTRAILGLFDVLLTLIIVTSPIVLLSFRVKNAVEEAKLTGSIIHKLLAAPTMREMKVELRLFSLQLLHERVSFTGYDFFTLDPTILHSILEATVLYLIMFFQP